MLTKIIYKNFRSNLKNYILFFLSNIVASMELFVFRGLKEIVLQIVKDTETAFLFRIDFTVALGMISVITIMLMAYAMIYYLKSRIRDYGLFIMMGMHKRMVFSLMLIEYVLGWVFSSILGLILGTGILYGIQFLLHKIAPLYFVRIVTANLNIYVYSIKFSIGIMIFTFFAVIVWIENHNLSSLIQAEEKIQKCPQKGYWTIAVIIGIILSVIAVACSDNLDSDKYFKDRRSLEDVFTDKESTEEWLAHAYSFLGGYNLEVSNMLNTITNFADDIYFGGNSLDAYKTFKTGTYDESYRHSWGDSYKGIRQASIFIQNIDMNTKYTEEERADMKAQARFVRAYYYWLLLRKYGPVPLLPDEGLDYTSDYDDLAIQRSSYDECVEYIESEMRLAAKDLPLTRAINQVARPTRGAALAARARALIYSVLSSNGNMSSIIVLKFVIFTVIS